MMNVKTLFYTLSVALFVSAVPNSGIAQQSGNVLLTPEQNQTSMYRVSPIEKALYEAERQQSLTDETAMQIKQTQVQTFTPRYEQDIPEAQSFYKKNGVETSADRLDFEIKKHLLEYKLQQCVTEQAAIYHLNEEPITYEGISPENGGPSGFWHYSPDFLITETSPNHFRIEERGIEDTFSPLDFVGFGKVAYSGGRLVINGGRSLLKSATEREMKIGLREGLKNNAEEAATSAINGADDLLNNTFSTAKTSSAKETRSRMLRSYTQKSDDEIKRSIDSARKNIQEHKVKISEYSAPAEKQLKQLEVLKQHDPSKYNEVMEGYANRVIRSWEKEIVNREKEIELYELILKSRSHTPASPVLQFDPLTGLVK